MQSNLLCISESLGVKLKIKNIMLPLLEKSVTSGSNIGKVQYASLCPKMDILAMVNSVVGESDLANAAKNELNVYRVSWQRVWSWTPGKQRIAGLSWRPDGKVICAHLVKSFVLLDVESGREIYQSDAFPACSDNESIERLFFKWIQVENAQISCEEDLLLDQNIPSLSNLPATKQRYDFDLINDILISYD